MGRKNKYFLEIKMPKEKEKQIYNLTPKEILKKFDSRVSGLSEQEIGDRLKEYGPNEIEKVRRWRWLKIMLHQFDDALVWILLVAAFLAFLFSEFRDVTIILIIVFVNAAIGFFQEFKAERILDSIKKLTTDKAVVIREGEKREIDTRKIVPGDIIFISSGDNVPADGYILESFNLKINSFIFTGESKPKNKYAQITTENLALADIRNMVFMGETVATGESQYVVTGTGMSTELGKIAHLTQEVREEPTPMQKQMRELGKNVSILAIFIGAIVIVGGQYFKMSLYQNFLFALALSVSVVPEGLPAAISVALSLGMKRLLKDNVLAKKLNAVETLGSISIICTDKTGTITKNELTVIKLILGEKIIDVSGVGYEPEGGFTINGNALNPDETKNLGLLLKIGALCNDASLQKNKEGRWSVIGDPTEGAIIVAAEKFNADGKYFKAGEKKIDENTFSSERMRMSVIFKNKNIVSYVKGSPDVIVELCQLIKDGEESRPITDEDKRKIKEIYDKMSEEALRLLAFAYRNFEVEHSDYMLEEAEKKLTWVGMMAMIDPPREDVKNAIIECKSLGIKPIMITGDYEKTAEAIAKEVALIDGPGTYKIIDGRTINSLRDKEVYKIIKNKDVIFARIAPDQKLRIANILKDNGQVIAMTGDGVNDAPALKRADIGVAMGIMGTDVSKEASDMILMDDNFASIVKGIKEGRTIFQNLKKFVHYVFTSNASELITVVFGVLLQIPSPISAVQILAIDLGTDIFPSFSLGIEPPEPENYSKHKKKKINSRESIMSFKGFRRILYIGIIMATGATIAFIWSMIRGGWHFGHNLSGDAELYIKSTAAAYAVLSMTQMANLLQSRSESHSPFSLGFFKNRYLIYSILISFSILLTFMYVPLCQKYIGMRPIQWQDWLVVAVSSLAVFGWEEVRKENER